MPLITPFPAEVDLGHFCASFGGTGPTQCAAEQRPVGQVSVNGVFFNQKWWLEHSKAPFHTILSRQHLFCVSLHQQAAPELPACSRVLSLGQEL